jgi:4-hydroxybenzoate polyprenyltransferase
LNFRPVRLLLPIDRSVRAENQPAPPLAATFHALSLYVAAGITSFGWALATLVGWDAHPWLPLWFFAALLVYNADRLQGEAADLLNIPRRTAISARLRGWNLTLIATASAVLLLLPTARRDWRTLTLVIAGAIVCLNYSRPLLGFRFKDVPLLKTLFAPTVVVTALIGLPLVHEGAPKHGGYFAIMTAHAWALLLFNMALCDLRDLSGDRLNGIVSLPVALGVNRTRHFLWVLLVVMGALALSVLASAPAHLARTWIIMSSGIPFYLGSILLALRSPRSEGFYEWWVEGILFLPALAVLLGLG